MPESIALDACCVLNLYATGHMAQILQVLQYNAVIGSRALAEAQYLKTADPVERQPVDLAPLIAAGQLLVGHLEGHEETALFVALAAHMEDGEAEAAALAIHRGWALATDERKVRRVLSGVRPDLVIVGTSDLLHEWQARSAVPDAEMSGVLRRVTERASFVPARSDPLREWWISRA